MLIFPRHRFSIISFITLLTLIFVLPPPTAEAQTPDEICTPPIQPIVLSSPTTITDCSNDIQLRAALLNGGHINFSCGASPVTIPVSSPMTITSDQDVVLDGGGLVTLDGGNNRILQREWAPVGYDVTIQNMRFINGRTNGNFNGSGGAISITNNEGTRLHIINSTFEDNRTTDGSTFDTDNQGGAIFVANIYETVIVGSVFDNNRAGNGGAFGGIASNLIVYNSRFTNNQAADTDTNGIVRGHGGAIHLDGINHGTIPDTYKVVDICGSVFENNTAVRGGGAIKTTVSDNMGTKATYQRSTFTNNQVLGLGDTEGNGGAIYHIEDEWAGGSNEDNIEISGSTFESNYAYKSGGGVWISINGRGQVINSTFYDNQASVAGTNRIGQGGGLRLGGTIDVINSTFANNFATYQGGAIFAGDSVTLSNSLFYNNYLDPTHTNPVTTQWQGYHTNRELINGGNNLQFPRYKPIFNNDINNLITLPASAIIFDDPLLGPLADNGGPNKTMVLQPGSPAIDAGNNATCPGTDQRGIIRPQGSTCDIGAFELVAKLYANPTLIAIDEGDAILTVLGADFTSSSQVFWGSTPLTTVVDSATTLRATVPDALIDGTPEGEVQITVSDSSLPAATVTVVQSIERIYLPVMLK